MYKSIIISLGLLIMLNTAWAQSEQAARANYMQGKEMYEEGRYDLSMEILKPLTLSSNKSTYSPYAAYYYSLSAIAKRYTYLAEEMLQKTIDEYGDWDQVDAARLWLARVYFLQEEYALGLAVINDIVDPAIKHQSNEMIKSDLKNIEEVEYLTDLYYLYPNLDGLAVILADKISSQPLMDQNRDLLAEIIEKFNLDKTDYDFIDEFQSIRKPLYNVAVLLPFMVDDLIPSNLRRSNQFVLDMYEGIKTGLQNLRNKGIQVNMYAYDTERSALRTKEIIDSGELDGMDLLIGPLYPEPVKLVSDFSLKKRINMFNPLSSNSDLIAFNPFCFLFKPTSESMAYAAADYIHFSKGNKNAMIFYEDDPRDSVMAFTYKAAIEQDSFRVMLTQKITGLDTISVYNTLTRKFRLSDLDLNPEDSLKIIERYDLYDYMYRLKRAQREEDIKKMKAIELFVIPPDSIGHIFVSTNKELIAASTISGMETRGDSITIIGNEEWFDYKSLSLTQMESLDIKFIAPSYISLDNPRLEDVYRRILYSVNKTPTKYHYLGYELINFVGEMLHEYGIYFQSGLRTQGIIPGLLYQGFDYTRSNDNRFIPIIEFKESRFNIVNY